MSDNSIESNSSEYSKKLEGGAEVRDQIFTSIAEGGYKNIYDKYGIRLVVEADKFDDRADCLSWIYGGEANAREAFGTVVVGKKVDSPEEGNIVLYGDKDVPFRHFGIVTERGTVMSKWNIRGPLLEHPIHNVGWFMYGDGPEFYKMPEPLEKQLKKLIKISQKKASKRKLAELANLNRGMLSVLRRMKKKDVSGKAH